jgi:hypothetical protein
MTRLNPPICLQTATWANGSQTGSRSLSRKRFESGPLHRGIYSARGSRSDTITIWISLAKPTIFSSGSRTPGMISSPHKKGREPSVGNRCSQNTCFWNGSAASRIWRVSAGRDLAGRGFSEQARITVDIGNQAVARSSASSRPGHRAPVGGGSPKCL